jgi:hypothetical protein
MAELTVNLHAIVVVMLQLMALESYRKLFQQSANSD